MANAAHEAYLETQILTATPQKLRLLLIDGALRFGRQALDCWEDASAFALRCTALGRCNDILLELYASIREDGSATLGRVKDIYRFLLIQLSEVSRTTDKRRLSELLEVLELERETWRQLCEQMPESPVAPPQAAGAAPTDVTAAGLGAIVPAFSGPARPLNSPGLSLEA